LLLLLLFNSATETGEPQPFDTDANKDAKEGGVATARSPTKASSPDKKKGGINPLERTRSTKVATPKPGASNNNNNNKGTNKPAAKRSPTKLSRGTAPVPVASPPPNTASTDAIEEPQQMMVTWIPRPSMVKIKEYVPEPAFCPIEGSCQDLDFIVSAKADYCMFEIQPQDDCIIFCDTLMFEERVYRYGALSLSTFVRNQNFKIKLFNNIKINKFNQFLWSKLVYVTFCKKIALIFNVIFIEPLSTCSPFI